MPSTDRGVESAPLATHNVVGSFSGQQKARDAKQALKETGIPENVIVLGSQGDDAGSLKAEMREEIEHSAAGGAIGVHNREQLLGASKWSLAGAAAGIAIGFVVGALLMGTTGTIISVIAFGLGGFVAGAVAGGLSGPRPAEDRRDAHTAARVTVGVHTDDGDQVEVAVDVLERLGADRVDRLDSEGDPYKEAPGEREWH